MSEQKSPFIRLGNWLASHFVTDVPHEIAHCEFGCREGQCASGQWETCVNRIETLERLVSVQRVEDDD